MKKATSLLLCLLATILLTGCGSNKLSCTLKEDNKYLTYEYEISFTDDKVDNVNVTWKYDFSDIEDFESIGCASLEECINRVKERFDTCENTKSFENCKLVKETDKEVILNADITKEELNSDESMMNSKTDREALEKLLKDEGFTCK